MSKLLTRLFGSRNDRLLKTYENSVAQINALEPEMQQLTDEQIAEKTAEFKSRVEKGETLDALLPEAFALCREASVRALKMRHFDVQMIGGMALHNGKISEMRTGEGKTLMATLPCYLNALSGKGVHVVTVNDYLASRDAAWMGRLYNFLGLTVGTVLSQQPTEEKKAAYAADITYGTNNEFGFDYLRDNMEYSVEDRRQRGLNFAVVDEVDSILIDEARTPLIISGQADDHTELYQQVNSVPPMLDEMSQEPKPNEEEPPGDYWIDRKGHQVHLSEAGHEKAERILGEIGLLPEGASLYDTTNILLMHHMMAALRAYTLFQKDTHYVVQNGEVIIVDEFTGRLMQGRRWSDGLHQAVEAKEEVTIQAENQTLASITFQNYFRMYTRLSGMTGTADTEAFEFQEIYGLETVIIPTHRPMVRDDRQDQVFRTADEKHGAILNDIRDCHERQQPVLVGTTSIENSELLSALLTDAGLKHNVLNAKQHEREAEIVAEAGVPGAITIATNMAGRGTDIVLGGNVDKRVDAVVTDESITDEAERQAQIDKIRADWKPLHEQVLQSGGLHIIGTERHESRRIDNQLRGRAGRQGDAGSSRFYLSMDDQLLKIFAGDRLKAVMDRLKLPEGEPIEAGMVTRSIEGAQRKVEARNFDIRKQLLEYDDVSNDQRKVVYADRNELMESADLSTRVTELRHDAFTDVFRAHIPEESVEEQWEVEKLEAVLAADWQLELPVARILEEDSASNDDTLLETLLETADAAYNAKVEAVGQDVFAGFERSIMLQAIDQQWREHLSALDHLRQGIHLRGYAQKNPKQEYKREAFELFNMMQTRVRDDVTRVLLTVQIQSPEDAEAVEDNAPSYSNVSYTHNEFTDPGLLEGAAQAEADPESVALAAQQAPEVDESTQQPFRRFGGKIGRNDPCPCGSGKKYKQCHGKLN
ncbi:MAG: preprotein translocase subunit SecA [Burkholderiaceae bacterium]